MIWGTNEKRDMKHLDWVLLIAMILVIGFGALNIYSTTHTASGIYFVKYQLIWAALGLGLVAFLIFTGYGTLRHFSPIIYWASVALLLFNDVTSRAVKGANSWIKVGSRAIEPGEFVKIGLTLMLARTIEDMEGEVNDFKHMLKLAVYTIIPMFLIIIQPNLGLTMICFFIAFGILFISGIDLKVIYWGIAAAVPTCILIWFSGLLKSYQKDRIISFLNPEAYKQDIGFQLYHSIVGIGSGGIFGKGFLQGQMISNGFIPEVHTDFIFASVGEEWGLIGAIFLILLYSIIILRLVKRAKETPNTMGRLVCIGVASSLLFSVMQNIGMTVGIMPIAGITLPFMSYGGSSMLANMIAVGLALSLSMRKNTINF
ncbi:MAG: rod shape-determining protein RodA [Bacillota bacterium]|nr:rod shape-determining protein RodA [Bacillota bacterium]